MENTVKTLKQYRANAIIEKKKHFNAGDRKSNWHNGIQVGNIILSALNGSLLFFLLKDQGTWLAIGSAALSFIVAGLGLIQKQTNLPQKAADNRKAGNAYLNLIRHINLVLAGFEDTKDEHDLRLSAEALRQEYDAVAECAATATTNDRDYRKAQEGIKNGEETYTENDLHLGE
jgi:hypothetical protein